MARPDKAAAVAEIADNLRNSNAALLTEYRGLTVTQLKELRRALSENATYAVVKNTLTKIAAKEAGIEGLDTDLTGPTAIAYVTGEPVEAAKAMRDFAKAHPALVIKSGVLDGNPLTAEDVNKLADLDSREVLLAKAAGAMKAKISQTAYLLIALPSQAVRVVEALRQKWEEEGGPNEGGAPAANESPAPAATEAASADATSTETENDTATDDAAPIAEAVTETVADATA